MEVYLAEYLQIFLVKEFFKTLKKFYVSIRIFIVLAHQYKKLKVLQIFVFYITIFKSPIYPGVGDPRGPWGGGFKVLKPPGAPEVGDLLIGAPHTNTNFYFG